MTPRSLQPRFVLAACSVAGIAVATSVATAAGPPDVRFWLILCSLAAIVAALQSAALHQGDLTTALLFSVPPVASLAAAESPTWLIAPLAALLLMSGELSAVSWECRVPGPPNSIRRRLLESAELAVLGFAAALPVALLDTGLAAGGRVLVMVAAAGLAGLGHIVFRGHTQR